MRDIILAEIRRIATKAGGKAPGRRTFENETGIRPSPWLGVYWARWGDALQEAGFEANEKQGRSDRDGIISKLVQATRHYGRIPTYSEMRMFARTAASFPSHSTVSNTFPNKAELVAAMRAWINERAEYHDVALMLPSEEATPTLAPPVARGIEGFVYLIKSGDFYKVGRSDDAERRFKQISVALPERAELSHSIRTDDPPGIEAYWHRRFASRRANGEWFKLTAADVAAFRKRKFQ